MKKSLLTAIATTCVATGAMAQGSLTDVQSAFVNDGITFGLGQAASPSGSAYFTGNVDIELLYSSTATAGTVAALNALDGTAAGNTALTVAENSDGFTVVSTTTSNGTTPGFADGQTFAVADGAFTGADPNNIGLITVPTSGTGIIAMYAVEVGGAHPGANGLIAWSGQPFGQSGSSTPAGIPADIDSDQGNLDMVTSTPEPTTLAFAGLGGLSLLLFRRRS